jgi:hypothetical protein
MRRDQGVGRGSRRGRLERRERGRLRQRRAGSEHRKRRRDPLGIFAQSDETGRHPANDTLGRDRHHALGIARAPARPLRAQGGEQLAEQKRIAYTRTGKSPSRRMR